jgi:hypothetical protein
MPEIYLPCFFLDWSRRWIRLKVFMYSSACPAIKQHHRLGGLSNIIVLEAYESMAKVLELSF